MNNTVDSLIKIAVVGPESTGKSTMAQYLAKALESSYVPEYARYYCKNLQNQYTLQDETNMFYGQIALEEAIGSQLKNNLLICDTTIMTVKIWCDHLFNHTPTEVVDEIKLRKYNLYLLMDIDLPWENDPLRDFPEERDFFMKIWKQELSALSANYKVISGSGNERLINGLETCKEFLKNNT
ncbi:nicotinamide-nucleotide adenylyltransferase, NadR type [Sphingobacterium nematocida]|uniref:Nicotinamide-nucleotide adenylyltransferase, NadR type n=1 Tax=Sphingobacterium nematocida TaxID=1513896 RepID=A0A1T5CCF2_9SPHI|nr:ATP-binding protein [Sphingobacterium nematocida]SKB56770.1 nicotinamide-nucleotide adenylyltransferase, NadR type [Sphingobacterium nematocida]